MIHTPATREGRFAVAVAAVLPFTLLTALVVTGWGPLERLDESVADSMASYGETRPGWVDFWRVGGVVLPWAWRALVVVVAGYLWHRRARMLAVWLVTTAALELAVVQAVKYAVDRERPADGLIDITSPAYVSGHATAVAVMAGAVLVVLPAVRGWSVRAKVAAWSAAVLIVLVTSADGIFLNVHYVSDVVGGWALGAALVTATTAGFALRPRSRARLRPNGDEAETPPRAAVIVNPVKVGDGPAFRRKVTKALGSRGFVEPLWLETTGSDSGHAMAKQAVAEEVDLVLVAGGDGTVRVVCAQLARTGIPVAVVPAGTGNLLARNLGIPMDLDDALYRLLDGRDRTIDLVEVHGDELDTDHFAVMAGLGLDAAIIDDAPADLKKRIGWPAYVVSAMKNINHPSVRVEITLDDQDPIERKARTVVIGNVGNLQANIPLLPDALPDDGTIDVIVIAPRRVTQWPRLIVRVLTRRRRSDPYLERFTGERVAITAAADVRRQLDGDAIGSGRTIVAQVEPGALVVRVPD